MRYHDYHLSGYSVTDFGDKITLHLVYDYPGQSKRESHIEFSGVACYRFVHTGGAIITDITEEPVAHLVKKEEEFLSSSAAKHGLSFWRSDAADYIRRLEAEGRKAWRIASAVGFSGFVIGSAIIQIEEPNQALEPTAPSGRGSP
jgi:hypothetical protein